MAGSVSSRKVSFRSAPALIAFVSICLFTLAFRASAQVHGVPPSVTSIQFHVPPFLPNALPSVTSLGPNGAGFRAGPIPAPFGVFPRPRGFGHGNQFFNRHNAGAFVAPYYFAAYDPGYGYDSSQPDPISSPGLAEQTLHVVVDLPPSRRSALSEDDVEAIASRMTPRGSARCPTRRPFEATVLVFRDGHQQQVTNYAIMGQTLYIFDTRTQKIGLSDLDIPATIKLNDDSGMEFHLPSIRPKLGHSTPRTVARSCNLRSPLASHAVFRPISSLASH